MSTDQIKEGSFVEGEALKIENGLFIGKLLVSSLVYLFVSILLNNFRATAPIALVWILIGVQFLTYFGIFLMSYRRSVVMGLNKILAAIVFILLAIGGRINDWEFLILPLLIVVMIMLSSRNKKLSEAGRNFQF